MYLVCVLVDMILLICCVDDVRKVCNNVDNLNEAKMCFNESNDDV